VSTRMKEETLQISQIVAEQLTLHQGMLDPIVHAIQNKKPKHVMTVGRGSSDHATSFAKYLFETELGWVTASSAPSIVSVYESKLQLQDALVIAVSQSGQSADICTVLRSARQQGALTLAIVNNTDSPLADAAELVLPIYAGEELSVAATKSFIATLTALIHLVSRLADNKQLTTQLFLLPEVLAKAAQLSWSSCAKSLSNKEIGLVLGRGFGFPIALEAALKFKETCQMHVEAFSSAEVLHGPFAIVDDELPLLIFAQADATLEGVTLLLAKVNQQNCQTFLAIAGDKLSSALESQASMVLPLPESIHPVCDPIVALQAFYLMAEECALLKGFNPDKPDNLNKVTNTV
jgi:glucosamine--fructose-6-phosphate aminotransferase (isomerizing)